MRQKLLLVGAVFFGLLAFVLTYQQIEHERSKVSGMTVTVHLIRFKNAMASGEVIRVEDIEIAEVKRIRRQVINEIPWADSGRIIGRTLMVPVARGHLLQWNDLRPASTRKAGLTGIIPMGHRAISIPVDNIASVSGLVSPGNQVDIIGTFHFPDMKGDRALDTLTLTILQNVTVLATGRDMGTAVSAYRTEGAPRGYSSVSLSLTPKEVEMIIFASQKGKLSLSLRNYEETSIETNLQSVNFRYLEQNLQRYNDERARRMHFIRD